MTNILERLRSQRNRESTRTNYLNIWRLFNKFLIKLDIIPEKWEDRVYLFIAHLIHKGRKSTTIRSYISAIKSVLWEDKYELNNNELELRAITRAGRLTNDQLLPRFPIKLRLLEMILFEIKRMFKDQYYLQIMFKTLFAISYYGLLRIGEVADGEHSILARNVHIATNKKKIMLVLYSSKTHDPSSRPQKIKISALKMNEKDRFKHFCPFNLMKRYMKLRGDYHKINENFFVFRGGNPVPQQIVRMVLSQALKNLGFDERLYQFHGIRAGRATNLHEWGFTIEQIKDIGRWKSNAIYKYIKN